MKIITVAALVTCLSGSSYASWWQESLLQNDLMAAMSWAVLGIDPYSHLPTNSSYSPLHKSGVSEVEDNSIADDAESEGSARRADADQELRQIISFQGSRPKIKVDIRFFKATLFKIHKKTSLGMFIGTGTSAYLDDMFHIKGRSRESNFLYALEDLVSLLGVDGSACVHRLLCEMGAAPMVRANGLFAELADLSIRHVLEEEYRSEMENRIPDDESKGDNSMNDANGSAISYLDAVAAGRHGARCAETFHTCPISLMSMIHLIRDHNL